MKPEELQFIELGESFLQKSDYYRFWAEDYNKEAPKIEHFKEKSQEYMEKVDNKLSTRPYFLKSKDIRKNISQDLFIKSEYSDAWNTFTNTNRINFPKFLRGVLPYFTDDCIQRLKHGKYLRSFVDGLFKEHETGALDVAGGRGPSYAVINPDKTEEFYTEDVIKDLNKEFDRGELVDLTKDEELINEALDEEDLEDWNKRRRRIAEKDIPELVFRPSEHKYPFQDFHI